MTSSQVIPLRVADSLTFTPPRKGASMFTTNNKYHSLHYSGRNCKGAAGSEARHAPSERRKIVKTVRLNHLRAALLAAAAGLLAAVGLVVVLYAQPAEANYPGKPGKIAYAGRRPTTTTRSTPSMPTEGQETTHRQLHGRPRPAYSPSGKKIVYSGRTHPTVTTRSTPSTPVVGARNNSPTTHERHYPSYSPSGKKIAYWATTHNVTRDLHHQCGGEARNNSPTTPRATMSLPTRLVARR